MNFMCQQQAIKTLKDLADSKCHSVLIEGVQGSGKTYLAKEYSRMLEVPDFQIISPNVGAIRGAIDESYNLNNPIVLCIENLDLGVNAASFTLLKFLEEPASNIYIVVTCRNIRRVPDTIISRSVRVTTTPPRPVDVNQFAQMHNPSRYAELKDSAIWKCATTFRYAESILNMTDAQLSYFPSLRETMNFKDTVSNIVWKLGHYDDNSETPVEIVINYIIEFTNSRTIRLSGIECMKDISSGRIAAHAAIAKFVFDCKYLE